MSGYVASFSPFCVNTPDLKKKHKKIHNIYWKNKSKVEKKKGNNTNAVGGFIIIIITHNINIEF